MRCTFKAGPPRSYTLKDVHSKRERVGNPHSILVVPLAPLPLQWTRMSIPSSFVLRAFSLARPFDEPTISSTSFWSYALSRVRTALVRPSRPPYASLPTTSVRLAITDPSTLHHRQLLSASPSHQDRSSPFRASRTSRLRIRLTSLSPLARSRSFGIAASYSQELLPNSLVRSF